MAVYRDGWRRRPEVERATRMLQTKHLFNLLRWDLLRREHPGLSEAELTVLWGRATYRPYVDSDTLDRWCACVRERAADAAPT